jgi:hypothetical protein
MRWYKNKKISLKLITEDEAKNFVPLYDHYKTLENAYYYTLTEGKDGWTEITYYTDKKRKIK